MRILAVKWRRLGDTILWTAALQALKQWAPDAAVDLTAPEPYLPLFTADPRWRDRFALTESGGAMRRLARDLSGRRYDVVLNFHASPRSRSFVESVGGSLRLIHHHDRSGKRFGSQRPIREAGRPASAIERDLNVVRTLGWDGPSPMPRLCLPDAVKRRGETLWGPKSLFDNSFRSEAEREIVCRGRTSEAPEACLQARRGAERGGRRQAISQPAGVETNYQTGSKGTPRIVLAPFASRPSKQWPLERFAELAERLAPRASLAVLHETPSLFDGHRLERVRLERWARLVPTPTLENAAGFLAAAHLFVGGDSGMKHLAAALGIPTVTLFGPESVGEWHGYGPPHRALQKEALCRDRDADDPKYAWCGESVCPLGSHACLTRIGVDEVAAAVAESLPASG